MTLGSRDEIWPELPLGSWKDTYATLHMWTQIAGKVSLRFSPHINHYWETAYQVTSRGITTYSIPYEDRTFTIQFDLVNHMCWVTKSNGTSRGIPLIAQSVASFYEEFMKVMDALELRCKIDRLPCEIPNPIPFHHDREHHSYDPVAANKFFRMLIQADRILRVFRTGFVGKSSPVHFFWGSFDLAVTRFSGRRAPAMPNADKITQDAYSHEVMSCGFWPGGQNIEGAAFYAYAAPEPTGFSETKLRPDKAFYNAQTRGFVLMYDDVRRAADPDRMVLEFCQSAYDAAADLGRWNRADLDAVDRRIVSAA